MQFVADGDDLLLVQAGSDFPVLVLTQGGISRSVALKLPPGAVIESFVPSSGPNWLVRVVENHDGTKVHSIYFFDSATGEPLREVVPSGVHAWSIACEANGKLLAFKKVLADNKTDGVWTLLTASDQ